VNYLRKWAVRPITVHFCGECELVSRAALLAAVNGPLVAVNKALKPRGAAPIGHCAKSRRRRIRMRGPDPA
jgi:hypothetical protein